MFGIAWHDFKHKRWGLGAYCLGVVCLIIMYTSLFPALRESSKQLEQALSQFPKGLWSAFGVEEVTFDTLEKLLSIEMFSLFVPLLSIILALSRAGNSLAGEIERGTMGLLLALPVGRRRIYVAKYLAGLIAGLIFVACATFGILPIAALAGISVSAGHIVSAFVISGLFIWAVFALGMLVSAAVSERGKVYGIMSGGLIVMYAANVVAALKDNLDFLKYGSFFYYMNAQKVITGTPIMGRSLLVFGTVIVVATALGAYVFNRRDISV